MTLDRVINVYPDWERLLGQGARCSVSSTRVTRMVRFIVLAMNSVLHLRREAGARIRSSDARSSVSRASMV